jgi:hypothetical protein
VNAAAYVHQYNVNSGNSKSVSNSGMLGAGDYYFRYTQVLYGTSAAHADGQMAFSIFAVPEPCDAPLKGLVLNPRRGLLGH